MNDDLEQLLASLSEPESPPAQVTNHIDVVANHIGTFVQEHRKRDVLDGTELYADSLSASKAFMQPPEWELAWSAGARVFDLAGECTILVIVASRGHGTTTFAQQLSARHASAHTTVIDLEADWSQPAVGKLPCDRDHIYLLELQDPESDRLGSRFLERLPAFAGELRQARSRLVLTVTDELWSSRPGLSGPGMTVVHLPGPPNAQDLVEHRLTASGHATLIEYVRSSSARESIRGRNAVSAMRCVDAVIQASETHRTRQRTAPITRPFYRADELAPSTAVDEELKAQIERALTDWRHELDPLFGEDARASSNERSLSLPNRCLLVTLAVHRTGPAALIDKDALALEVAIKSASRRSHGVESPDVGAIFAGSGLRPRLIALGAVVDLQDRAVLNGPGYAEAVLGYVWDNFAPLREVLLGWLVSLPPQDRGKDDPALRALSVLILRHKDPLWLENLQVAALAAGRAQLLTAVTELALKDDHMSRSTWKLLTRWAGRTTALRHVVGDVCRLILASDDSPQSAHRMAMTRLRNLAQTDDEAVRAQVLEVFDSQALRPGIRRLMVREIENWLVRDWPAPAGRLALLALMGCYEQSGLPWLLSTEALPVQLFQQGLRELFRNIDAAPESIVRTTAWLRASDAVLDELAPTLCGASQAAALVSLLQAVQDLPDGIRIRDQLFERIAPQNAAGRPPSEG